MTTVIAGIVLLGSSALFLWAAKTLSARTTAAHPVATAAVTAGCAIPLLGGSLAWFAQGTGVSIEQGAGVFATLAQILAALLIAFTVETSAYKAAANTTDLERRELAAIVGGLAGGFAVGLAAAVWGLVHPRPGLAFLGTAVAAIAVSVAFLTALPVSRILRRTGSLAE